MAWIESHQELREHPKTISLCEHLGAVRPLVVGHLHLLWWWCIDYAPTGDLTKYTDVQISRAAEWGGPPPKFMDAMISSGFIERIGNSMQIHDWEHYCGALMERRLKRLAAKRPPSGAKRPPTLPNPTIPNHTTKNTPIIPFPEIPEDLKPSEPEIRDWLEYKQQKGQKYKPKGLEALWRAFRAIPKEKRREAVDYCMGNNWSGLFERKGESNGNKQKFKRWDAESIGEPEGADSKFAGITKTIRTEQ